MVDSQWLSRGNIVVHRTGCYYVFACSNLADVEALLEQHSFVLDGRICNIRRCNRYTVPANVKFDITRLWIRVYGLPLGILDPEWAVETLKLVGLVETLEYDSDGLPAEPELRGQVLVDLSKPLIPGCFVPGDGAPLWVYFRYEGVFMYYKKCGLVGHFDDFCHSSDYVAARRITSHLEAVEAQGLTVLYNQNLRPFYTNMIEGLQDVFINRNTRVNLLVLAQDFEYDDGSSSSDDALNEDNNDDMDNDDDNNPHGNNNEDNDDNEDNQEPPDDDQDGDNNQDSDDGSEPDNSDSSSSGAGGNGLPNGHVHAAAPAGDDNDNIVRNMIVAYDSASSKGIQNSASFETDPTTPESYHNPNSTRFLEENRDEFIAELTATNAAAHQRRAAIPSGDPYAPYTYQLAAAQSGGGFRMSAPLEDCLFSDSSNASFDSPSNFSSDISTATSDFSVPMDIDIPSLFATLSINEEDDSQHVTSAYQVPTGLPSKPNHRATPLSQKQKMGCHNKRSRQGPFTRCRSYDQLPYFGYAGSFWYQKRSKIKTLNLYSKSGFLIFPPSTTQSVPQEKCYSDVSAAAHLGFFFSSSSAFLNAEFNKAGSVLSNRKRKVTDAWISSTLKYQKLEVLAASFGNDNCSNVTSFSGSMSSATPMTFGLAAGPSQLPRQRCKKNWILKGDCSSKLLFAKVKCRQKKNIISSLVDDQGLVQHGQQEVQNIVVFSLMETFKCDVIPCYDPEIDTGLQELHLPSLTASQTTRARFLSPTPSQDRRHSGRQSYGLRGLHHADALLSPGCNWKVGNGNSILAGSSNWVNGSTPTFHPRVLLTCAKDWTVIFFIHPQTLTWDADKVHQCFLPADASAILALETPTLQKEDFRFWASTASGNYTVKTGYAMLIQPLTSHSVSPFWKVLWSLQLQPKWKLFLWKLFHNGLVVKSELQRRGVSIQDVSCDQCITQLEDFNHLF
uniref:Reverse transcriptase zinc-binding domain-containing protein n=1 Tax=Chenopodium quinoa TaxID=63459 RepID=A0A803MM62_CHEQI